MHHIILLLVTHQKKGLKVTGVLADHPRPSHTIYQVYPLLTNS